MFRIPFGPALRRPCDRVSRRHALRIGATGLLGGLSLPHLLQKEALSAEPRGAKAKSCIFLFLEGGPPHQDMWDMKPDAPIEVRGPFQQISTNVPGTFICEHLPHSAKIADKYTILRHHSHNDNGHSTGYHYLMTGRRPAFADGEHPIPTNELYPSLGSFISKELGPRGSVPPYINLPHPMSAGGPGFLGAEHAPFVIDADPSQPDFEVKDLLPAGQLSASRLKNRRRLLETVEEAGNARTGRAKAMKTYYEKAFRIVSSPEARKAFDLRSESEKTREMYGHTQAGQCALLARRLVQAGCRFVGVDAPGWDVHFNCFPSLKTDLIPYVDKAFAALVTDLDQRGMLDSTLVVMMGEMGRTPRVNAQAGRDHWSMAQTIIWAGGGTKPGQILGATTKYAEAPVSDPVSIDDVLRTIHILMGIDADKVYPDPLGRPVPIVSAGRLIPDLT